jgi:pyruvate/2-oxoglutarate dehydrogenase complex dihydrolipoamide acyltransferase (E2) component
MAKYSKKAEKFIAKRMRQGYAGEMHSSTKKGPVVTKPSQMKAIALSEARKKGLKAGGQE